MINGVFPMAVTLALTVHTVFGCCLHHAHGFGHRANVPVAIGTACSGEHHHHHHPSGDRSTTFPLQCNEGPCTFTGPDFTRRDDSFSAVFHILPPVSSVSLSPAPSRIDATDGISGSLTATVRLHLLNQIMLI